MPDSPPSNEPTNPTRTQVVHEVSADTARLLLLEKLREQRDRIIAELEQANKKLEDQASRQEEDGRRAQG